MWNNKKLAQVLINVKTALIINLLPITGTYFIQFQ